ncbi:MAG TPA: DoxX family protein [Pseudolabrys sp.]
MRASPAGFEDVVARGGPMSFADKFNLFNEFNLLRIICGAFFIPHIVGKVTVPATLKFFTEVGFKPPAAWMGLAGAIEVVLSIGLIFGLYTSYIAAIAFIHLLVAAAAMYKLNRCWIWVIGGVEFCIFWALCCLVVAMHG